jgi:hypothetical protein
MNARNNPSTSVPVAIALVAFTIGLLFIRGIGELLVLAVGSLLVTNYLAHRYAYTFTDDRYQRHRDRMD